MAEAVFENGKRGRFPRSIEASLAVVRAISSERGKDLAWRREVVKTSVRRCSPWRLPAEKGLTETGISQNSLSTMEDGKVEIGAEILLRISREFREG